MGIFKLFKKEPPGRAFRQSFEELQLNSMDLTWNNFWNSYDGLLKIATLRQSPHLCDEHPKIIDKMFDFCLIRLRDAASDLLDTRAIGAVEDTPPCHGGGPGSIPG